MYVITNRNLNEDAKGLDKFEKRINVKGPNELRLVEVKSTNSGVTTEILEDKLEQEEVNALIKKHSLVIDGTKTWYSSLRVACLLYEEARRKKKSILFYVHGYNNDMGDVLRASAAMEKAYDVIVLVFSWPANGGGIEGYPAYLSDKRDARASCDALARAIQKISFFHEKLTEGLRLKLQMKAETEAGDNPTEAQIRFSKLLDSECHSRLNMICHSMGNYVLKYALIPGHSGARSLVFDNVALVAADANNKEHEVWVERIQTRNRLYIVINENDFALKWSRRKPGEEQLARLGHYLKELVARNATYLNVTEASWVKGEHGYFWGEAIAKNEDLKRMFEAIFEGDVAETDMRYRLDGNYYELK
ncbi:alpha/beta hydrolase [Cerasicoccus frondis]|uniref:alpha/beta hydrolase n=1 Tax=Cerasicoccus frondis TaxID=490090 RepID=UPI002852A581|nr:alpha/beta hydrolase [Cerasicoccus frondis]